jgi:hypothetical protein
MRKHIGLLFIILGAGGVVSILLGFAIGIGILNVIGIVLLLLSALAGLISNALSTDDQDPGSWTYMPEEGLKLPTKDKAQLPLGGYTSGQR